MDKIPYGKFAEVYDKIMGDKFYLDYYRFIIRIIKKLKFKPKNVLEIACGTGRLAGIFLNNGYDVEGLDRAESMLNLARKRGLTVHIGDMTDFHLVKKYDLALCIFDSLNYINKKSDLQKCFISVNSHINSGGIFIFDMNSDFKINKIIPKFVTEYYKADNSELIWLNSHKKNKWIAEMILFEKTGDDEYNRFYEKHVETAYTLGTIKALLRKSGFELIDSYGDFDRSMIKKNSKRWFFVCRKL